MSEMPDWTVWILAAGLVVLFGWFFWHTGASMIKAIQLIIQFIETWPERRRAFTEAEARAGGRFPFWYRAARVLVLTALVVLLAYFVWVKLIR